MALKSYLKFQNQNVRMCGFALQNIHGRSHGITLRILLFFVNEIYTDTHSKDSCGKESSKKHGWNVVGKKYQIGNAFSFTKIFLSIYVDDIKMDRKKQNLALMWQKLMKDVDIEEPTSFLLNWNANQTRKLLDNTRCVNSRISAGATEKLPRWDMLENPWNGIANWQNKETEQLFKVSHPCLDDHQIRKEE